MKRVLSFVFFLSFLMPSGALFSAHNNDWQTKPPLEKKPSNSQGAVAKNMPKKQKTMPWYKKPAVKYGVGCLVSLLATVYAVTNYVDTEALVIVEPAKSEAENKPGDSTDEVSPGSDATENQTVVDKSDTLIDDEEKKQAAENVAWRINPVVAGIMGLFAVAGLMIYSQ